MNLTKTHLKLIDEQTVNALKMVGKGTNTHAYALSPDEVLIYTIDPVKSAVYRAYGLLTDTYPVQCIGRAEFTGFRQNRFWNESRDVYRFSAHYLYPIKTPQQKEERDIILRYVNACYHESFRRSQRTPLSHEAAFWVEMHGNNPPDGLKPLITAVVTQFNYAQVYYDFWRRNLLQRGTVYPVDCVFHDSTSRILNMKNKPL